MSKLDSFTKIVHTLSPDVISLNELKHKNPGAIRTIFKKLGYKTIIKKESGVLIATKTKYRLVDCTSTTHSNILVGRLTIKNTVIRVIAAYGPQEKSPVDQRTDFYDELSAEIESCDLHNDSPIIIGDINAKIECNNGIIGSLSSNGELLLSVIQKYSLSVLNFHPLCTGKWTCVIEKNNRLEQSVLDYVLTNSSFHNSVQSIMIDEERLFTPFSITKKSKTITYTDHNAIISSLSWQPTTDHQQESDQKSNNTSSKVGWRLTSEGLEKFNSQTSNDPSMIINNYEDLDSYINKVMNSCFRTKQINNSKNPNHIIQNKQLRKIFFSILKPLLSAGTIEKSISQEYIQILQNIQIKQVQQARANRVSETLMSLENETHDFSVTKFWKLKKFITSKGDKKASILT